MLNYPNKIRVLKSFKNKFEIRPNLSKASREYVEAFNLLTEDEQLELITLFERSQSISIAKAMSSADPNISVPAFGTFKINNIRKMFVDMKKELSGTTAEERRKIMYDNFKFNNKK